MFLELNIFRQDVGNFNAVLIVQIGLPVVVGHLLINDLSKNYATIAAGSSTESAISGPGKFFN